MLDTIECLTDIYQREFKGKVDLESVVPNHEKGFQHTMPSCMPGKTFTTRKQPKQTLTISHEGDGDISGCHILPNGQLILVNKRQRRLLFYDSKNNCMKSSTKLTVDPFDVAVFDKTVVASICNSNVVAIFNLETRQLVSFLEVPSWSWGIDVVSLDNVILRFPNKDLFEIRDVRKGNLTQTIPVAGQYILYVAWFSGKVYCTNWASNQVKCYDECGKLLWCFQDQILMEPMGITTDAKGNIYVSGSLSNNVVCISKGGKNHHVILDEKDGLNKPHALHYQKESNQLLVCNRNDGKVTLCQIE